MSFQYTYDAQGKPVGVFIPINKWEQLTEELRKNQKPSSNSCVLKSIEKGLKEMEAIKKRKLSAIPFQQALNEL